MQFFTVMIGPGAIDVRGTWLLTGAFGVELPAALVLLLSVVIGLVMVVVFRFTSNQAAIRSAKDQLKAHLLAVRLFQDQLPVVFASYGRILGGTGRYLRLALKPLMIVVLPLTFLIVQLDRYFGWTPLIAGQTFLVKVRASDSNALDGIALQLPPALHVTAPAVHIPAGREVVWRVAAEKNAPYEVTVLSAGEALSKQVTVLPGLARISPVRLRAPLWERIWTSAEPALPAASAVESIEVSYPARTISFAGMEWNWIWLFFVLSLIAGFLFKSLLGIEV